MKYLKFTIIFLLISTYGLSQVNSSQKNAERIKIIKAATVQILIDGIPSGTGFYINSSGLIATNMHVIEAENLRIDSTGKIILSEIEIITNDNIRKETTISDYFLKGEGYRYGKFYDLILIEQKEKISITPFLKVGSFSKLNEGDNIYTCGYPFGITQPVFAAGIVSTKFKQYNSDSSISLDVAWLDLSINKGNSGGAVMVMQEKPSDDYVVGIASFNLNVLSSYAQQLKNIARNRGANIDIGGLDIKGFAELTAIAIEANSYGIGGMISIDYLRNIIK